VLVRDGAIVRIERGGRNWSIRPIVAAGMDGGPEPRLIVLVLMAAHVMPEIWAEKIYKIFAKNEKSSHNNSSAQWSSSLMRRSQGHGRQFNLIILIHFSDAQFGLNQINLVGAARTTRVRMP
jgi:hypothetical protein